uniref:Cytochrome-b5 reductase n=1 Tax=Eutreptiella gymnastica TaxID=73025 RepID=A0A7S4LAW5_9EUGL
MGNNKSMCDCNDLLGEKSYADQAKAGEGSLKELTWKEVGKHTTAESVWFVVDGKVYDGTAFLEEHPGGAEAIIAKGGRDASEEFNDLHSSTAKEMLQTYVIGRVVGEGAPVAPAVVAKDELTALDAAQWTPFELVAKEHLSRDVVRLRFALPSTQHRLGLPVGWHMLLRGQVGEEAVVRPYTPTSSDDDRGFFELVIKIYFAEENPTFPEGGRMSQWLHRLRVGETVDAKGPVGHFEYRGKGKCCLHGRELTVKRIGLIAGGTGITPCLQVLKAIAKDPADTTEAHLLFANKSPDDVICMDMLEALAAQRSNIHVWYTVDSATPDWQYSTGFVTPEMMEERLFRPQEASLIGMCGPPPMYKFACVPGLEKLGFKAEDYFQF